MVAKKKAKKVEKKSASKAKGLKKGSELVCEECGLVLVVDDVCGCDDCCDVICCGEQMLVRC
jgi:hypothetical protein